MEKTRGLSSRLYDVLETVGASEKMRKLHTRTARTWEIILTVFHTLRVHVEVPMYICGSTYEGSVTPGLRSDVDGIQCEHKIPVVLDLKDSPFGMSLLMTRDEWTYPGYVKLQLMQDRHPLIIAKAVELTSSDELGRLCMLHFPGNDMDGPASKEVDENGIHISDHVRAYKCRTLPVFVRNRLDLLRERNVISVEECDKLNGMGCMFVGAGFFLSPEKEIEWRLSLTFQERHLMSKLNPTQHKVYILLKMFRKNIIEKVVDCKVLTSYHCKTAVLYAVEMTAARSWTPDNLIPCLKQCVKLLILWLKKDFCPTFFNIDCNLFLKKGFSQMKKLILRTMELLLGKCYHFLTLIQTDHVGHILVKGVCPFENEIASKKHVHIGYMKDRIRLETFRSFLVILHRLCGGQYDALSLSSALHSLQQTQNITEHTTVEIQMTLRYLYPWFHLHIAKSLACSSYRHFNRPQGKNIMRIADVHFHKADMTDLVNVRLAKVSVLYKAERYAACWSLLQEVENEYTHKVTRHCPCSDLSCVWYRDDLDIFDRYRTWSNMSVRKIMKKFFANCVIFLPSEFDIVPTPLHYEMIRSVGTHPESRDKDFWFECSVIDAKVYLYFMQYLMSTKLQKHAHKHAAISNINAMIEEDTNICNSRIPDRHLYFKPARIQKLQLGHIETAYNLLGWIYMQETRYGDALQCFFKSWKLRPFHNAAKFHMRDLLKKMSEIPAHRYRGENVILSQ